jgi:hypothetical protein
MTAMGDVIARLLIHAGEDRPTLYSVDLACSACGALATVPLLGLLEGPGVLFAPALLLAGLASVVRPGAWALRSTSLVLLATCLAGAVLDATRPGPLVTLSSALDESFEVYRERWNHHSRVRIILRGASSTPELVIDRSASSFIPPVRSEADVRHQELSSYVPHGAELAYRLGDRPLGRVGIVGVGGGPDVVQALRAGAARVDGFELNGLIVGVLWGAGNFSRLGELPGVRLEHEEARHALAHSADRYDVLRVTLTDTWAATAQGGFVLAEAALYTREAWQLFLSRLTPSGRLAVTRWLLPTSPAEAERTIALASRALLDQGLDPAHHLLALGQPSLSGFELLTVVITPSRITAPEVAEFEAAATAAGCRVLLAPGRVPDPQADAWRTHFTAVGHERRVASSVDDLSVPTDVRPFFFLQKRPQDIQLFAVATDHVSAIVQSGVRGLVVGWVLSVALALVIIGIGLGAGRHKGRTSARRFCGALGLGLGYMLLQLGLHQRFSVSLGHPTVTLACVVAAFILGSGLGSVVLGPATVSSRVRTGALLLSLGLAWALVTFAGAFGEMPVSAGRVAAGAAMIMIGVGLGGQLPALLRRAEERAESVATLWIGNGAASVAGAGSAAVIALVAGSVSVVVAGIACYVAVIMLEKGFST